MAFRFHRLEIPDVILVEGEPFKDQRGFFIETYKKSEFSANGIPDLFLQDNLSHSVKGTLRGLHYQNPPEAQAKLVMALRGEVFDVAVDIRRGSPHYRRWVGVKLSAERCRMVFVPVGFAHGFCVLTEEADVLYKVTGEYSREHDQGIRWDDPEIGIRWPIEEPVLSPKDARLPFLEDADNGFLYESGRAPI